MGDVKQWSITTFVGGFRKTHTVRVDLSAYPVSDEERKQLENLLRKATLRIQQLLGNQNFGFKVNDGHFIFSGSSANFIETVLDVLSQVSVNAGTTGDELRLFGERQTAHLHRPPGYGLLRFADFFYSKKSVEECLRPTIQDLQDEYAEALAAKRPHKARWVRLRGTWSFVCAAGMLTMASIGKQVVKIWKAVG